jgi:hypothetical protein
MKKLVLIIILTFSIREIKAQQISGFVYESNGKEPLIGVHILTKGGQGTVTDNNGYFNIGLSESSWLYFNYLGYKSDSIHMSKLNSRFIKIYLQQDGILLDNVEITANKDQFLKDRAQTGFVQLSQKKLLELPALLGEPDVIKALQTLPGIKFGVEGSSGIYVRGGGNGHNLFLIDNIPVYNADHAFGFLSIVPSKITKNANVYKSGFPAEYGNRLSSVIDIQTIEGNKVDKKTSVGLSTIAGSALTQGSFLKGKASYVASGRYSLLPLFSDFGFYDGTIKVSFDISERNKLNIFTLLTSDTYDNAYTDEGGGFEQRDKLNWQNKIAGLQFTSASKSGWIYQANMYISDYKLDAFSKRNALRRSVSSHDSRYESNIRDVGLKQIISRQLNKKGFIKFGIDASLFATIPERSRFIEFRRDTLRNFSTDIPTQNNWLASAYSHYYHTFGKNFDINFGVRAVHAPQSNRSWSIEPRLNVSLGLRDHRLKASYNQISQYNHFISNANVSLPTDSWVNSSNIFNPATSSQISIAYLPPTLPFGLTYETEVYYKTIENDLMQIPGFNPNIDSYFDKMSAARGEAYGWENMIKYQTTNTSISLAYTLAKANRQFYDEGINSGKAFPFRFDKRHDININGSYYLAPTNKKNGTFVKRGFHADWTYNTGAWFTLQTLLVYNPLLYNYTTTTTSDNRIVTAFPTGINNYNAPDFHRLNISVSREAIKNDRKSTIRLGIYNTYFRKNVFVLQNNAGIINPPLLNHLNSKIDIKSNSIFPILPFLSIDYEF